jgi:hypothetical protein
MSDFEPFDNEADVPTVDDVSIENRMPDDAAG